LAEIETVAADAARDMVARISGVQASEESARNAVKAALAHG
jgi:F-type H+-transporting ATPase subunit b